MERSQQYAPPVQNRQRKTALAGLGPLGPQPSLQVADVIAQRERIAAKNTIGLEPFTSQTHTRATLPLARIVALWHTLITLVQVLFRRNVPVLLQMSEVECGAACLAMILHYYGRKTRISEISDRYGVGRDGLSALHIVRAAREYGLRVRAISLQQNDFYNVTLPAIVHWQFNHFLIVERWSAKRVQVVDPASGRKWISGEEFDGSFTGVVILLEPGTQFVRNTSASQVTLRTYIVNYIKRAPSILVQVIIASLLLQLFGLALPLLTAIVLNRIIPAGALNILSLLGIGIFSILLAQLITMLLRASLLVYLQARIDTHMMPNFFEHMLSLPALFFQKRTSGDILMRLNSNTIIRDLISSQLVSTVLDGSLVIVYLIILLTQSWPFGVCSLCIGLVQVLLLLCTAGLQRSLTRRELEASGKTQGYVGEVLTSIESLKASGAEQQAFTRWSNLFFDQLNASIRHGYLSATIVTLMSTLQALSPFLLLWIGATQVIQGNMQIGTMLALNALAAAFLAPLGSLVASAQQLQLVHSHLERIADVLDAQPEQDVQRVQQPPRLSGHIQLNNVSFQYDANSPRVLKDISVQIEPGKKVAIVGRTGSGKSTLGRLLLGLCLPTAGEIYYDNIPLRFLNYQAVRAQFGVVMQNPGIFSGTIRQNIMLNAPDVTLERVIRAAQLAELHEEIMKMPMGYDTYVSEGGSALSGGQRQRLALARALVSAPSILLLDEATSALDVVTERRVEQNLKRLPCTQIIIAHRLSTVRDADCLLVLEDGMLLEQGTHQQLMRQNRYYARLIHSQLTSGEITTDEKKVSPP